MAVVLITGSSTGIGLATALHLARNGYTVYASMRRPEQATELQATVKAEGLDLHTVQLDVDDDGSVSERVAAIEKEAGGIDVLVNNAGIAGALAIEEMEIDFWKSIFETNLFGAIRMTRAVLPAMRKRGSGTIVNVTSVAGRVAIAPQAAYAASKHALEAASEVLAQEVQTFGIRVAIIEPGVIVTPIFQKANPPAPNSAYGHTQRKFGFFFMKMYQNASQPGVVAEMIQHAIETDTPKLRYPIGSGADELLAGRAQASDEEWTALGGLSDDEWFDATKRLFGLDFRPQGPG